MKLSNNKLLSLALTAVGLIWCFGIYAIADLYAPALPFGGGVLFGLVAIAIAVVYLLVFRRSPDKPVVEVEARSVYFTLLYFVATLVLNTVLVLARCGGLNKILFLCNFVLIAFYVILILGAEKDAERLSEQLAYAEQATAAPASISKKLGTLLSVAEDPEIRKQLLALKEAVDYSSNVTTGGTFEVERDMEAQLDELTDLIANHGDAAVICEKIRKAETTWKLRSSAASAK
jgi:hypothetical protein